MRLENGLTVSTLAFRSVETDVSWIKGKLEGRSERRSWVFNIVTACAAIAAVIVALIALLK